MKLRGGAKKLIVVLSQGRPRLFKELIPSADAILYTYLSGPYGGPALANIIFGRTNPSGRLSFPYPSDNSQRAIPYPRSQFQPQWPLGFGLSFSTFNYSRLQCPKALEVSSGGSEPITEVSIDVTNMGPLPGLETVILWMSDYFAFPNPESISIVRRFKKVSLAVGETAAVAFSLTPVDFRHLIEVSRNTAFNVSVQLGPSQCEFSLSAARGVTIPLSAPDPLPKATAIVRKVPPVSPPRSASSPPISASQLPDVGPQLPSPALPPTTMSNPTAASSTQAVSSAILWILVIQIRVLV